MRFDGKMFAAKIEEELKARVEGMRIKPKLTIVMMGEDEGSRIYVAMKKKVGERVGIGVEVKRVESPEGVRGGLKDAGRDGSLAGLMVQLPLLRSTSLAGQVIALTKEETEETLRLIPLSKDVDGLNPENLALLQSGEPYSAYGYEGARQAFVPATVKAVEKILDEAFRYTSKDIDENLKVAVVGAKGMVGRGVAMRMRRFGMEIGEFESGDDLKELNKYEVVISVVGQAGLINPEMVKDQVIAIDVGFPQGDFDPEVEGKAEFFTPVPGGVGPVTVVSLLENVVLAVENAEELA